MTEWNDFYVAIASASSALTGLIFVGISINLTKILSIKGLADRALLSLILLVNILVVSILFLVPKQTGKTFGIEVMVVGFLTWAIVLRLDIRVLVKKEREYKLQYLFNLLINQVATILFIFTGIALIFDLKDGEYLIIPAILLSLIKAIIDAWVLLVEINR